MTYRFPKSFLILTWANKFGFSFLNINSGLLILLITSSIIIDFEDGSSYVGGVVDGMMEGKGIFTSSNNTDNQILEDFVLSSGELSLSIENANNVSVDLSSLMDNTDEQEITSMYFVNDVLNVEIENGNTATVDLSTYMDNTDDQEILDFSYDPQTQTISITIEDGGTESIQLSPLGLTGATGAKGTTGDNGVTGDKGSTGAKGTTGDKGDKGATGDKISNIAN